MPCLSRISADAENLQLCDDPTGPRAFVLCDDETLIVEIERTRQDITLERLIITSTVDSAARSPPLASIAALKSLKYDSKFGMVCDHNSKDARLVCHDGTKLLLVNFHYGKQVLPRRIQLKKFQTSLESGMPPYDISGTPTKLMHLTLMGATVVSGVKFEHLPNRRVPEPAWQGKRMSRGFITILPDGCNRDNKTRSRAWNYHAIHIDLGPEERALCACYWIFDRGGGKHPYIVVGTSIYEGEMKMIEGKKRRLQHGRLWFFNTVRNNETGEVSLELRAIKKIQEKPVRALAVLDSTRLLVAPHGELRIYSFSESNE